MSASPVFYLVQYVPIEKWSSNQDGLFARLLFEWAGSKKGPPTASSIQSLVVGISSCGMLSMLGRCEMMVGRPDSDQGRGPLLVGGMVTGTSILTLKPHHTI